jgi:hypothetical protein
LANAENIISATLQLRKYTTEWKSQYWTINGYNVDDAGAVTRIDNLAMTTASVLVSNDKNDTADTWYTWDVTTIVQEIVNRGGWASGNDLALIAIGNGSADSANKQYYSYDTPASAAKLDITYGEVKQYTQLAISQVGTATTNGTTVAGLALALTVPTGVQVGDLLIAALAWEVASPTITVPAGWTNLWSVTPAGTARTHRQACYYRVWQPSDVGTTTFTWSTVTTGYERCGIMAAFRNAMPPTAAAGSTVNSSVVGAAAPTISTARANALLVMVGSKMYGTTFTTPASPGTWAEIADYRTSTGTANMAISMHTSTFASTGAVGTVTANAANADYGSAGQLALEISQFIQAALPIPPRPFIDSWR